MSDTQSVSLRSIEAFPNPGARCLEESLRPALSACLIQMGSVKCLQSVKLGYHEIHPKSIGYGVCSSEFRPGVRNHCQYHAIALDGEARQKLSCGLRFVLGRGLVDGLVIGHGSLLELGQSIHMISPRFA